MEAQVLIDILFFFSNSQNQQNQHQRNSTAHYHNGKMRTRPILDKETNAPFAMSIQSIQFYIHAVICACAMNVL